MHPAAHRIAANIAPESPPNLAQQLPRSFGAQLHHAEERKEPPPVHHIQIVRDHGRPPVSFGPGRHRAYRPPSGHGKHGPAQLLREH